MRKLVTVMSGVVFVLGASSLRADVPTRSSSSFLGKTNRRPPVADAGGVCSTPPPVVPPTGLAGDTGNTCTGTNHITNYGGVCATDLPFPYPGPELIYQLNLGPGNNPSFSANLTGSTGDLALFLVGSACGTGTNCVAHSQDAIGAGAGPETIAAAAQAPGTYFLYIDSYYGSPTPASCGTYSLTITPPLPVELLEFDVR